VYLTLELKVGLAEQLARVQALERDTGEAMPWVFPHLRGPFKGRRIKNFFYTWRRACREVGCGGLLRHDLRRTAIRNMINMAVPERVTMAVTGHKTPSVLHRYCIVSPADLRDVARRLSVQSRHSGSEGEAWSGRQAVAEAGT
jgi:integrase